MKGKKIFSVLSSGLVGVALSTLYSMLLARVLSVPDRGVVQFFVSNVTICSAVILGGAGQTVAYAYKSKRTLNVLHIITGIAPVLALLYVALTLFGGVIMGKYALDFSIQVGTFGVTLFCLDVSKAEKIMKRYANLTISQGLISAIVFAAIFFGAGKIEAASAVHAITICSVLLCCYSLNEMRHVAKSFEKGQKAKILDFRAYFFKQWLMQSLGACVRNIDKIAIGWIFDARMLGMYAICVAFDAVPSRLYQSLADLTYSNHFHVARSRMAIYVLGIGAATVGVLFSFLLGDALIRAIFGRAYEGAGSYLPYVILASCVNGISWMLSQSLILGSEQGKLIIRQIGSIIIMIAIMYLYKDLGLWGAIIAINVSAFLRLITSIALVARFKKFEGREPV